MPLAKLHRNWPATCWTFYTAVLLAGTIYTLCAPQTAKIPLIIATVVVAVGDAMVGAYGDDGVAEDPWMIPGGIVSAYISACLVAAASLAKPSQLTVIAATALLVLLPFQIWVLLNALSAYSRRRPGKGLRPSEWLLLAKLAMVVMAAAVVMRWRRGHR